MTASARNGVLLPFPRLSASGEAVQQQPRGREAANVVLSNLAPSHDRGTGFRERPNLARSGVGRWFGTEPPETQFVIERIVPRGMVTLLAGDGGAGKTLLLQIMMTSVAAGTDFLGMRTMSGAAAGLFAEDPDAVIHGRQLRICRDLGVPMDDRLSRKLHAASYLGTDVVLWRRGAPTRFFGHLENDLSAIPNLMLVGIDSASLVFAGNENDRGEVASFMMHLNGMADRLKTAILLLSHTSKTQNDSAAGMASGSTSWVWQARSALRIKLAADGAPELSHPKANHARKINPIMLRWSELGVLHPAHSGGSDQKSKAALISLDRAISQSGEPAPDHLGGPSRTVVRYDSWRPLLGEALFGDDKSPAARQALKRLLDNLERSQLIKRDGAFVWPVTEVSR